MFELQILFDKFKSLILRNPLRMTIFLSCWVILLNGYGLRSLEFVRHTEADRSLIAWEMNESNNYLVPTLLGSQILTKPPLFYWITAFFQKVLNSYSEVTGRLSSLFAGVILVVATYWFWLVYTNKRRISALMAFALSCSVLFYILIAVAEIDMTFGCYCALSLYAGFFVYELVSIKRILVFSLLIFLAFLAKGPPVYFFIFGTFFLLSAFDLFFKAKPFIRILKSLGFVGLGVLVSMFLLLFWLYPLSSAVGWESLGSRLEEEVFNRVTSYSERGRGPFFYVYSLLISSLPWSIFLIIGLFHFLRTKSKSGDDWSQVLGGYFLDERIKRLFIFSLTTLLAGFFMLSVAQGKSHRYAFPLVPFLVNICVLFSPVSLSKIYFKKLIFIFRILAVCAPTILLIMYLFISDSGGVSMQDWIISAILIALVSLIGLFCSALTIWRYSLPLIAFLFFTVKVVQTHVYASNRNYERTVKPIAQSLVTEVNKIGLPVYTIEMFERWTVFYAKHLGLNIKRLNPDIVRSTVSQPGRTLLLLDYDEEGWRFIQAKMYSQDVKIERIFPHHSSTCYLISVPNSILDKLGVFSAFPTNPSQPFYPELEARLAGKNL